MSVSEAIFVPIGLLVLVMPDDDPRIGTALARAWLALGITWSLARHAVGVL